MLENSHDRVEMRVDPQASGALIYDASVCGAAEAEAWLGDGSSEHVAGGRGGVHFVATRSGRAVVRHYHRGGLVARWLGDRFLWLGARRTRPVREFSVLARAHELGLHVPRPVAARYVRRGVFYTADLATRAIEPATTLARLVTHGEAAGFDWRALGRTIRAFHDAGIWHADLNAHNVLRDDAGSLWLLDFDRGWLGAPRERWRRANLARLERSLRKLGIERACADAERDAFGPLRAGYAEEAR